MQQLPIRIADRYELGPIIGRGGMGEVYLGHDLHADQPVAIKTLRSDMVDATFVERFKREGEALRKLNHPGIVQLIATINEKAHYYLVMEYVSGGSLADLLRIEPRLPLQRGLALALDLADALARVHHLNIIHRDIKPANVLLTAEGLPRLTDFGLAFVADQSTLTRAGTLMGTASYLSPEAYRGEALDQRTDTWSFGVMLYEIFSGRRPFVAAQAAGLLHAILSEPVVPLAVIRPELPLALSELVAQLLVKDRAARIASMRQVAASLEQIAQDITLAPHRVAGPKAAPPLTIILPETALPASAQARVPTDPTPANLRLPSAPKPPMALIGRDTELAQICAMLGEPTLRLLTLTGPGGIGKTRLARQVAVELKASWRDGAHMVALASVRDPSLVPAAIVEDLALDLGDNEELEPALINYFRERKLLLMLDNFEQVIAAAPFVARLLNYAPGLKLLVTSRECLQITDEYEFPVTPLALPPPSALPKRREGVRGPSADERNAAAVNLEAYAATQLFVQRARAVKPNFAISGGNDAPIAEICRRLDGLPLAIELAAARVKLLSPQAILTRLDQRLDLLVGGPRDRDPRQQTLRAAIDWSYDLLDRDERRIFEELAVFAGSCELEAAEAVLGTMALALGDAPMASSTVPQVLDLIAALLNKSLLTQYERDNGQVRLDMLETIREYALERFETSPNAKKVRQRHALWYLALAEAAQDELNGSAQEFWLDRLTSEHDNLRGALHWAVAANESLIALRLGAALWRFWLIRGHTTEGRRWLSVVLQMPNASHSNLRAAALNGIGALAFVQGAYQQAEQAFLDSMELRQRSGDRQGLAGLLTNLGSIAFTRDDYERAASFYNQALYLQRELGDRGGMAIVLNNLGNLAFERGDYTTSHTLYSESLALAQALGDLAGAATALNNLGEVAVVQGFLAQAQEYYSRSLEISRELKDPQGCGMALNNLGHIALDQGNLQQAEATYRESLRLLHQIGERRVLIEVLEGLAGAAATAGQMSRAALLWGATAAWRQQSGHTLSLTEAERHQRQCTMARQSYDQRLWEQAWHNGQLVGIEQAVNAALE